MKEKRLHFKSLEKLDLEFIKFSLTFRIANLMDARVSGSIQGVKASSAMNPRSSA
jgi:hypothetical protein